MISLDSTFFYQVALFLLLWIVLTPLLFKPMLRMFERRENGVKDPEERSRVLREELDEIKSRYEAGIGEALSEADRVRSDLLRDASAREREILAAARKEMEALLDQTRKQIDVEKDRAMETLRSEANRFAVTISESLLGRKLEE